MLVNSAVTVRARCFWLFRVWRDSEVCFKILDISRGFPSKYIHQHGR